MKILKLIKRVIILTISEAFYNTGVFTKLLTMSDCPNWLNEDNAQTLDFEYFFLWSGKKEISDIVQSYLDIMGVEIANDDITEILLKTILFRFGDKWSRFYNIKNAEYNPLENYDLEETTDETRTVNLTDEKILNMRDEDKNRLTESEINGSTYGFNSATPTPTQKNNGTVNENGVTEHTGTDTDTHTGTDVTHRVFKRHGDIGVENTTQMLQHDIDFWNNYNFYLIVFADIDSVLTLDVY